MLVPGSLAGMSHSTMITDDILLQDTACSVCVETRATALQVILGSALPYSSILAGYVLWGKKDFLKWLPRERDGWGAWKQFYKSTLARSSKVITLVTVAQMIVAGALVYGQNHSFYTVMDELDRRIQADEAKKRNS